MAEYRPEQGDIVMLNFSPQAGHEQAGRRPALVVSNASFHRYTGLAIFCPITNQIKDYPLHVRLDDRTRTTGEILCEHVKSLDYRENRKLCACIRKMTDEDWERYLRGDEDLGGLARGYSDRGALVTHIEWPCVPGMFLTIDTTIYDVLADGETVDSLTFTKLMNVVRQEDGPEVAVQFLDNILMPLNPKTPEQLAELNGIRERLVKLAKEARGEA